MLREEKGERRTSNAERRTSKEGGTAAWDLEERLLEFSVRIVRLVEALPKSRAGTHLGGQLMRSGTSPLLNHGEAEAAESPEDFIHKLRIVLKELRETQRCLKLIERVPLVKDPKKLGPLLSENDELIRIFVVSVPHRAVAQIASDLTSTFGVGRSMFGVRIAFIHSQFVTTSTHILGIRHHGPGSARSVRRALDELRPQCVLIEGPPDADELIAYAGHAVIKPPVSLLVHDADEPADAVYYPFAEFSPEWQAMRWAIERRAAVRFMDLPQFHRMAIQARRVEEMKKSIAALVGTSAPEDGDGAEPPEQAAAAEAIAAALPKVAVERDPLQRLAEAAGFDDGERWWEHVVESQREHGVEIFAAIREAMAELRATPEARAIDPDEPLREAWMRRTIREAVKEGHASIAVICGAWHAPALNLNAPTANSKKQDDELLKGLPKIKTAATWVPWTYDRLTFASGYGAGVHSPGWYEHLWATRDGAILESWMTRVARLLREKDIDCSSAHVIEAVRLSESLAALRGRPLADLSDIGDATRSIFCFDSDLAMRLIASELLVGVRMGEVPDDVPMVPLQQDLSRLQKRLRLKPEAQEKPLALDLRNDNDRERSVLLHRLRLLDIHWGVPDENHGGKGTFRESWLLRWQPEFAIALIEAGVLGNTIERASAAKLIKIAGDATDLKSLAARLQDAMLADLDNAARALVQRIENVAAVSSDVALLMETLPSLASLLRYGNVRQTDETMVRQIVDGMLPRITVGLGGAVASLNDDAAARMEQHLGTTEQAIQLIDAPPHAAEWHAALARILSQPTVHGLIRGRCARLLSDAGQLDTDAIAQHLSQTLSRGTDPADGARWLEGFLRGSGLLLIHDPKLLALVDAWVVQINADVFQELLPLLRRTFTTFPAGERRQIGQMVKTPGGGRDASQSKSTSSNSGRARRPLALLAQILGGGR